MSQASREPRSTPLRDSDIVPPVDGAQAPPSATWQGWAYFGAVLMLLIGLFQALLGLITLFDEEYFSVRTNTLVAIHNWAPWGWVHLIGGLAALAAGAGILMGGHPWARTLGIVVAALSAVVNVGFLQASPVWSALLIAIDVLVIYALTVHGRELDTR
jgi:hypothetical protein